MKSLILFTAVVLMSAEVTAATTMTASPTTTTTATATTTTVSHYECTSERPENVGFHNMVMFGKPDDQLYVYHLPLFTGSVNGETGHVLMHVYQGLWKVQLDAATHAAYASKFKEKKSDTTPFPFFTIGPQIKKFKVPEMFCNPGFSLQAFAVFGHIEGNRAFPAPEPLLEELSTVSVVDAPVFARRFDGQGLSALTYMIFGTPKQHYMAHFLTDDESSFDQIVAIDILDANLKALVAAQGTVIVKVPVLEENGVMALPEYAGHESSNNKWKLRTSPLGQVIKVADSKSSTAGQVKVTGEIYFNNNGDLRK
ncbi:MAG: hypothetical protein AB7G93_23385 [Bdellovibrionales bacterium]